MKLHSRYILKHVFPATIVAILVSLVVLLFERALRLLSFVLESNPSAQFLIELLTWLTPYYLGFALPCALFLGILVAFNRLSRDGEIASFLALGFSFRQLFYPVFGLSLAMALIIAILFSYIQPHARYFYTTLQETAKHAALQRFAGNAVFANIGDWVFIIDEINTSAKTTSTNSGHLSGFLAYSQEENGQSITLTARRGIIHAADNNALPILTLYDGSRLEISPGDEGPNLDIASIDRETAKWKQSAMRFQELHARLQLFPYLVLEPRGFNDPRQLTIPELLQVLSEPGYRGFSRQRLVGELHGRIVRILSTLGLPFLAIAFGLAKYQSHQAYRFLIGMGTILLIHIVLKYGEVKVEGGDLSPLVGLWTPLALFFLGAILYYLHIVGSLLGRRRRSRKINPLLTP